MDATLNALKRGSEINLSAFARMRTDSYVLLASVLGEPPTDGLRKIIGEIEWEEIIPYPLQRTLSALREAGCEYSIESMKTEFDKLFIGLGCGEIIPYASWYQEKRIQSRPLATLRTDLNRLGIMKKNTGVETEDHAGSLCEVMAIISVERWGCPLKKQADFFSRHLMSWMPAFFTDLSAAKSAKFYRRVGAFGSSFMEHENFYLGFYLHPTSPRKKEARQ